MFGISEARRRKEAWNWRGKRLRFAIASICISRIDFAGAELSEARFVVKIFEGVDQRGVASDRRILTRRSHINSWGRWRRYSKRLYLDELEQVMAIYLQLQAQYGSCVVVETANGWNSINLVEWGMEWLTALKSGFLYGKWACFNAVGMLAVPGNWLYTD